MTVDSELFSENHTTYDISTFECEVNQENSLGFVRLLSFEARDRSLFSDWESNEYKELETNILSLFSEIQDKLELYELVFPPVQTARNMRKPGLYKINSSIDLHHCITEGIRENEMFQVFIPELKVIIENGHDFFFNLSYHKSRKPEEIEIQQLKDCITMNKLIII